jgi:hypothetical protein
MNASHERHEKRTIHDTRNERTIHERTNEIYGKRKRTNARYTKDTQSERTIHEQTNHWSITIYYPMTNDSGSIEVKYSIVLLFE